MAVTLILPLAAPLGVGRIVSVDEKAGAVQIRDLTTGIVYRVPGSVLAEFGALPWRGRVQGCTVEASAEGTVTELVLDANPVGAERRGAADALRGAQQAADDARDQAANWGGTDHRAHEIPERFW